MKKFIKGILILCVLLFFGIICSSCGSQKPRYLYLKPTWEGAPECPTFDRTAPITRRSYNLQKRYKKRKKL